MTINKKFFRRWLNTKPKIIRDLAAKYPPDSTITVKGETMYVVGYTEGGDLMASTTSMSVDYDKARETTVYICAGCLEGDIAHIH